MRIQGLDGVKKPMAQIALPVMAVKRTVSSRVCGGILFLVPSDLLIGDNAMWVALADHTKDSFAVKHWGLRAGTRLKVVDEATSGGVISLAEGAGDLSAAVDFRVKVLRESL
jgi:hypothetical protein